jgi:hypothetical protein
MRAEEIVNEGPMDYVDSFVKSIEGGGFLNAFKEAKQNSRIRKVAQGWLDTWKVKLDELTRANRGKVPPQQILQAELSQFVHGDMQVPQSRYSVKGIQELVDYSTSGQIGTNKSLNYMTALFTLSLVPEEELEPEPEVSAEMPEVQEVVPFGEQVPTTEKIPGNIIPVKVVQADGAMFVKYDGEWFYDMDGSGIKFVLSPAPLENPGGLEMEDATEMPVRIGPSGTRSLRKLRPDVAQEWLKGHMQQAQGE